MSCATNSWLQLLNLVRLEPWKEASSRQYFTLINLIVSIWLYTRTRNDCAIGISKLLTQNLASYFMVTLWHQFYKQFVLSIPIADQGNQKRYFKELNQNDVETIKLQKYPIKFKWQHFTGLESRWKYINNKVDFQVEKYLLWQVRCNAFDKRLEFILVH